MKSDPTPENNAQQVDDPREHSLAPITDTTANEMPTMNHNHHMNIIVTEYLTPRKPKHGMLRCSLRVTILGSM